MRKQRMLQSLRMLLTPSIRKRTAYVKKKNILGAMGDKCRWGPWLVPLYPKLIKLGSNVRVHKSAKIVTHDVLNGFLEDCGLNQDFGSRERLGCVELGNNVYLGMNVVVLPDVRIGDNCIITAGSVVNSDIPANSVASGNPAQVVGRFDRYMALRKMSRSQTVAFKNQELPDELALAQWEKFEKKRSRPGV